MLFTCICPYVYFFASYPGSDSDMGAQDSQISFRKLNSVPCYTQTECSEFFTRDFLFYMEENYGSDTSFMFSEQIVSYN